MSLEGEYVHLEPLRIAHSEELRLIADMEYFQYFVTLGPHSLSPEDFALYIQSKIDEPNVLPFCVRLRAGREAIGATSYMDIRAAHRGLEIGMTWIDRAHWGTKANPETKYLLLRHAFEELKMVRVQLKTDARNLHSQQAITKLGARQEGTLRKHGIQRNGFIRDTVMFSITDNDWPNVKQELLLRLESC